MAKKTKAAKKRTKVKDIPKSKREMTGEDMRKVKGGITSGYGETSKYDWSKSLKI
jgi:hypothetical protein